MRASSLAAVRDAEAELRGFIRRPLCSSASPKGTGLDDFSDAPGRIRTCDPRIRSPPLCPLSYSALFGRTYTR